MKKNPVRMLMISFTACMLIAYFAASEWHPFSSGSGIMSPGTKPTFQEKKVALIPIIVIGGLRFYRKTFEKK